VRHKHGACHYLRLRDLGCRTLCWIDDCAAAARKLPGRSPELVARGWQLFNYPARPSYSATPPDFGALVVQRRRWPNGGLLTWMRVYALNLLLIPVNLGGVFKSIHQE
jgi:hypothetical protein